MIDIPTIAGQLYEEYCYAVGGCSYDGQPLPSWESFNDDPTKSVQSNAWVQVGRKAVNMLRLPTPDYRPTPTLPERVFAEKKELDDRRYKLAAFIGTEAHAVLPELHQKLLRQQLDAMNLYALSLGGRIDLFNA